MQLNLKNYKIILIIISLLICKASKIYTMEEEKALTTEEKTSIIEEIKKNNPDIEKTPIEFLLLKIISEHLNKLTLTEESKAITSQKNKIEHYLKEIFYTKKNSKFTNTELNQKNFESFGKYLSILVLLNTKKTFILPYINNSQNLTFEINFQKINAVINSIEENISITDTFKYFSKKDKTINFPNILIEFINQQITTFIKELEKTDSTKTEAAIGATNIQKSGNQNVEKTDNSQEIVALKKEIEDLKTENKKLNNESAKKKEAKKTDQNSPDIETNKLKIQNEEFLKNIASLKVENSEIQIKYNQLVPLYEKLQNQNSEQEKNIKNLENQIEELKNTQNQFQQINQNTIVSQNSANISSTEVIAKSSIETFIIEKIKTGYADCKIQATTTTDFLKEVFIEKTGHATKNLNKENFNKLGQYLLILTFLNPQTTHTIKLSEKLNIEISYTEINKIFKGGGSFYNLDTESNANDLNFINSLENYDLLFKNTKKAPFFYNFTNLLTNFINEYCGVSKTKIDNIATKAKDKATKEAENKYNILTLIATKNNIAQE